MTSICQEHQNKGKPYIFTHDPKLFYFILEMKSDHIIPCSIKDFLNNNDIFVEEKKQQNIQMKK